MGKSKKILIAMDLSNHSLNAVKYVAKQCAPKDLRVNLMYVMPTAPETYWDLEKDAFFKERMKGRYAQWKRDMKKKGQVFLDEAKNILVKAKFGENKVGLILRERKVGIARDILKECTQGYDAVAVGRKGLSKLEDIFLGAVSTKIVQGVKDIPVWVVGGDITSKKMLLAVDSSENSRKAVAYAGEFAADVKVELALFHVVRSVDLGFVDDLILRNEDTERRLLEEVDRDIPRMFRSYKDILVKSGVIADRISSKSILHSTSRAGDILREAKEGGYGTIVMGRRGLSKVREFLMGRVTSKVLSRAEGFAVWIVPWGREP
jgi:nucleotide-binding universal stress UspA family protein